MPGFLDEWVEDERSRLGALHARALARGDAALGKTQARDPFEQPDANGDHAAERAREARNLPAYVSVFFDRETEQHQVLDALAQHRLVTLAGLGGTMRISRPRMRCSSARRRSTARRTAN